MKGLPDFARERGVSPNTVATYVRRHPELFDGHTRLDGKKLMLDNDALQILDELYPEPETVQIVENIETVKELAAARKELSEAKDLVIKLQAQILTMTERTALAEANLKLIESKDEQITMLNEDLQVEKSLTAAANARAEAAEKEAQKFIPWLFGLYKKQ